MMTIVGMHFSVFLDSFRLVLLFFVFTDYADMVSISCKSRVYVFYHLLAFPLPFTDLTIILHTMHANADRSLTSFHI